MTEHRKRVLIFSTAYLPFIGGAEIAVKEITDRLPDCEFVLVTARLDAGLPEQQTIGNVTVRRIGKGKSFDKYRLIKEGPALAKTLGQFDTVWAIMASYAGFAALRYKKRHPNTRFVLTLQEGDSRWDIYKHVWWCWPYFKQIFGRADQIQAISTYLKEWAHKMGAICPIEVIPNGATFSADNLIEKESIVPYGQDNRLGSAKLKQEYLEKLHEIDKKYNLKKGDFLIMTVSRLVKKNGLEDLVRAMSDLPGNYKLRIVGEGKLGDKFRRLTRELKLEHRVFFEGLVPHNKIWLYYHNANVFVRPSLSEGLGNVFLEAMHFRKPVIATPVGGIPDLVKENETGWFCKVRDPKSIVNKILFVTDPNNKEKVDVVKNKAQEIVTKQFGWQLIAIKMKTLL